MDQDRWLGRRADLVVLQSFRTPRPTTNPYLTQLLGELSSLIDVRTFTWRRALFGRYDVLHVHWPEVLLRSERPLGRVGRRLLFAALLLRLRIGRAALVRTVHNTSPHDAGPRIEQRLIDLCERWTTLWITLLGHTPGSRSDPSALIPHGHYIDWFAGQEVPPSSPGRLVYFGLIRPYKGVEALLAAFAEVAGDDRRLLVAGSVSDPELGEAVRTAAAHDPRVRLRLEYVDDADLVAEIGAADLVVLPYREMHSSGALLLALSLRRRVLVPASPSTLALAQEVGPGWVLTYDGTVDADVLEQALASPPPEGRPDLSARDWPQSAAAHVQAYERARDAARGRPPVMGPDPG